VLLQAQNKKFLKIQDEMNRGLQPLVAFLLRAEGTFGTCPYWCSGVLLYAPTSGTTNGNEQGAEAPCCEQGSMLQYVPTACT